ncbi:MAG: BT_3928 family protein [Bacteroidota bacterium]
MKGLAYFVKYLAGGLLIFSGLVKLNDPVGTEIKLKEYFEVFATDFAHFFEVFVPLAMPVGMFLIILEIIIGVALIINYRFKWTITIMTLMMVFFTFLTFYSAFFNKVTDCGCFGDAIHFTPWQSFSKDIFFLVLIAIMLWQQIVFKKESSLKLGNVILVGVTILSIITGIRAINHLPFVDFRPYAIGENIQANMQAAEQPVFSYVFEKNGKQVNSDKYLTEEEGYTYVSHRIVNEENTIPKITDYNIWNDEYGDYTSQSLFGLKLFIIIYGTESVQPSQIEQLKQLVEDLGTEVEPIIITSIDGMQLNSFFADYNLNIPFFYGDATVLKTMVRSTPGIMLMEDGNVLGKWHYNDIPSYEDAIELID